MDIAFRRSLKSKLADISNVGGRQGSSSIAAMFLENFVKEETPWIHLDIAGVAKTNSSSLYSKGGATGWGVISIFEYLRLSTKKLGTSSLGSLSIKTDWTSMISKIFIMNWTF